MRKLNENKVYDLSKLTIEERLQLFDNNLASLDSFLHSRIYFEKTDTDVLFFRHCNWQWHNEDWKKERNVECTDAKELFLTLENIQVDCRGLSKGHIEIMADVFEKSGFKPFYNQVSINLEVRKNYEFLRLNKMLYIVAGEDENKTTITYDKFMELFGENYILIDIINDDFKRINDKPSHYSKGIDTFERMEANCTTEECLAFAKGNIDKYNWREKGQDLEDFKKIINYANWAIKLIENENK